MTWMRDNNTNLHREAEKRHRESFKKRQLERNKKYAEQENRSNGQKKVIIVSVIFRSNSNEIR